MVIQGVDCGPDLVQVYNSVGEDKQFSPRSKLMFKGFALLVVA